MSFKFNKPMRKRAVILLAILLAVLTLVSSGSLVNIMILNGEKYQGMASEQQLYDSLVTAPRGDIYDSNMNLLATSTAAWTVYITPNGIVKMSDENEKEKVRNLISDGLSEILGVERETVYADTGKNSYYVVIKKRVDKSVADKVREFLTDNSDNNLSKYVGLDETTKRYYPNGNLASSVIGFVGADNQGLAGVESYYENTLTGVAGRIVAAKTAHGTNMPFTYEMVEEAQKGNSLVLSIDSYIQYVCEKHLAQAVEVNKCDDRGMCVVMNVKNGEVYGMAVKGDFDPNEPFTLSEADQKKVDAVTDEEEKEKLESSLINDQWRNKAISDSFEPGSVFKIVTGSIALEENLATINSTYNCTGHIQVAGQGYNCHYHPGHGVQTLMEAMSNSCNPAFIMVGQKVGVNLFSKYFKAFGLTAKTGIDLPGEATSIYYKEEDMGPVELASASFGQTFKITPMQLITATSAAVNGGYLVKPHVVKKTIDADGKVTQTAPTDYRRQVISETTSATMRTILERVIHGGAINGYVPGYRVGGKTGTAEKVSEMLTREQRDLYVASFVGFAPINDPEIAIVVMLSEPKGSSYYGGAISAPVASSILAEVLPYLGYEPQFTESELKSRAINVPDVVGKGVEEAKNEVTAKGLIYRIVGEGDKVIAQLPASSEKLSHGGLVIFYTENKDDSELEWTSVPDFTGKTLSEVGIIAAEAGINTEFSGTVLEGENILAYMQSITPKTSVKTGTVVTVYFRDSTVRDFAPEE